MKPTTKPHYRYSLLTGLWVLTHYRWHDPPKFPMTLKGQSK